ncbi:MAG: NADH-quinone oxidoreductase subunit NuoH [Desulfobulbaceae bacterium]|nr:NADH-quinone oxidoreductase subunit NuoH [Desulfobulbaceae bacterium]
MIVLPRLALSILMVLGFIALNGMMLVYMERKVAGHMQRRLGPMEVGPHGILQTLVDGIKLIGKQYIPPYKIDRPLYLLAPVICFVPVVLAFITLPFSEKLQVRDLNVGLLVIFALGSMTVLSLFMAGWSSNNKYSLIGAFRSVSQSLAYEIPMLLSVLSIVLMTNTLSLREIVEAQSPIPHIVFQPVAFLIFFICCVAETNRAPFDLPEAESELTAGFHTEYSGMGFALFFLAEYTNIVVVCATTTVLFLGGWKGIPLPFMQYTGVVWFLIKLYLLVFVMMWFRWTYPRVRIDQLLNLSWKVLTPLALINLVVTAVVLKII